MKDLTAKWEEIKSKFKPLSIVALVIGKLYEGDDLCERIKVGISLFLTPAVDDLLENLFQITCKQCTFNAMELQQN